MYHLEIFVSSSYMYLFPSGLEQD